MPAAFFSLKLVLGSVLVYDVFDRGIIAADTELMHADDFAHVLALFVAQACIGLCMISHRMLRSTTGFVVSNLELDQPHRAATR